MDLNKLQEMKAKKDLAWDALFELELGPVTDKVCLFHCGCVQVIGKRKYDHFYCNFPEKCTYIYPPTGKNVIVLRADDFNYDK